jgi:hypothetical protein
MNNPLSGTDPTGYCGTASRIDGGGGASPCSGGLSEFGQQLQDPDSAVVFQDKDGSYFAVTADNNGNLTKWTASSVNTDTGSGTDTTNIGPQQQGGESTSGSSPTNSESGVGIGFEKSGPISETTEPSRAAFDSAVKRIFGKVEGVELGGVVQISSKEFSDIRSYEANEIDLGQIYSKQIEDMDLEQFRNILQWQGDSVFIAWDAVRFSIEGYSGAHLGADINYYYQGLLTAAAGRSKFMMLGYVEAHNLNQAYNRRSLYDLRQIVPARRWAVEGYKYYTDREGSD